MRTAAKIDRNQQAIVAVYREAGLLVLSLANMGRGVPDLLVGAPPVLCLVEVKMPGNTLTPDQVRFHSLWPVVIVTTKEEALAHAQTLRASVSDVRAIVPFVSGYAAVLLQPMFSQEPQRSVLPPHGTEGRVNVGRAEESRPESRAGRHSGPPDAA